jgi:hypothetical protein
MMTREKRRKENMFKTHTLHEDTQHGNHREAAVLDLLNLEDGQILRVGGNVEEIERTTRVDRVDAVEGGFVELALERDKASRTDTIGAELLDTSHENNVDGGVERHELKERRATGFTIQENLAGFRPDATRNAEGFRNDDARNGEHRPASVENFVHAVLFNRTVSTEAKRIKTIITGEGTIEVGRNVRGGQETARQVELAVRACARASERYPSSQSRVRIRIPKL